MGHSSVTPNINLPQFDDTDKPSWRGDLNGAFADIDTAHAALAGEVGAKADAGNVYTKAAADTLLNGKVSKASLPRNVRDYGALADGTDATAAIQAAINAAGQGGQVYFPLNDDASETVYTIAGQLTALLGQRWFTGTQQLGYTGTGNGGVDLAFTGLTGTQAGITAGGSFTMENMRVVGPGAVAQPTVIGLS